MSNYEAPPDPEEQPSLPIQALGCLVWVVALLLLVLGFLVIDDVAGFISRYLESRP